MRFAALDYEQEFEADAEEELAPSGLLALHEAVPRRIVRQFLGGACVSVTVMTASDAPAGSGLGSSSTLVVAMIEAYRELLALPLAGLARLNWGAAASARASRQLIGAFARLGHPLHDGFCIENRLALSRLVVEPCQSVLRLRRLTLTGAQAGEGQQQNGQTHQDNPSLEAHTF